MTTQYIQDLSQNPFFARQKTHHVVANARVSILSGVVSVGVALFLMSMARSDRRQWKENPAEYLTTENLDKRIRKVRDVQMKSDLFAGAIAVFTAVMTIVAYRPSNAEASQAALLKYLRLKGVVEDDFMTVVKNVRPYRIKTLNI